MKITKKENANGRISAYYVDGVKVCKCEIDCLTSERRNESLSFKLLRKILENERNATTVKGSEENGKIDKPAARK